MPLVDTDIFEKCQRRLTENQRKPASFKPVEDKYILTGKIFCGHCGSTMNGTSGTSKTGVTHRYYHCHAAKKKNCDKKRTNKAFIESAVLDYIMRMLDDMPLIDRIVDICYALQSRQNANLPSLERQLKQTEKEINNVMNAIKQGIITTTKETLIKLEQDKESIEISIAKERIERPVLSKEQIKFWICKFGTTNLDDIEQKQRLIDVFLNSVYVYDDKMLVVLNYKDGEKTITITEITESFGSDLLCLAQPTFTA